MEKRFKSQKGDFSIRKFYQLSSMDQYNEIAKMFLNNQNASAEDIAKLEYNSKFSIFYENEINKENVVDSVFASTFNIVQSRESKNEKSANKSDWKKEIKDMFDFDDGKTSIVYTLYKGEQPISFALLTQSNDNVWHLELIYTHANYEGNGYASKLLKQVFKDMGKEGINNITSIVEKTNDASISLHQKLANDFNCKATISPIGNIEYTFLIHANEQVMDL